MTMTKTRWLLVGLLCLALAAVAYVLLQGGRWESYNAAGVEEYQRGDYAEAEKQLAAAIKEAEGLGSQDPRLATSLNGLAGVYRAQGRYAEAEPLYRRALAIREKALGAEHPDVAQSLNNLALLYAAQGRFGEAEPLHKPALAIREGRGAGTPPRGHEPQQPGGPLPGPGPVRRGGAASQAGTGHPGVGPGSGVSQSGHEPQQPGGALPRPGQVR